MSQATPVARAVVDGDLPVASQANVSLKGTSRGLEILIASAPSSALLGERLMDLLAEAPGFFAGSDARVAFEGALPAGSLACLEEVAGLFELKIVEIGPVAAKRARTFAPVIRRSDDAPQVGLAEGTGPIAEAASAAPAVEEVAAATPDPAGASDAAPVDAAPVEVALANTAPYGIEMREAASEAAAGEIAQAASAVAEPADVTLAPAVAAEQAPEPPASSEAAGVASPPEREPAPASAAPDFSLAPEAAAPVAVTLDPAPPAFDPAAMAAAIDAAAEAKAAELVAAMPPGPKLVMGPVRSGVIVDHTGHVIVLGDVNPGAEVRAEGSIIVLGRLRGVAHAGIGRDAGAIIALSLQPQQLRICRTVARAGESDRPSDGAEIAYINGETIVVERFLGRLPSGLAASM